MREFSRGGETDRLTDTNTAEERGGPREAGMEGQGNGSEGTHTHHTQSDALQCTV